MAKPQGFPCFTIAIAGALSKLLAKFKAALISVRLLKLASPLRALKFALKKASNSYKAPF